MTEPSTVNTCVECRPWPDGGCDFGCPCADCESGRRAEYAAVTSGCQRACCVAQCDDEEFNPNCSECRRIEDESRRMNEREASRDLY